MQQRMMQHWRGAEDSEESKTPQQHNRREQKGYRRDLDAREAPLPAKRVEEHGHLAEGGLGHP